MARYNSRWLGAGLIPYSEDNSIPAKKAWTSEKNHRRCDLIDKKIDAGLSVEETEELELLTEELHRHVEKVAPLPMEYARQLYQELLAKVAAAKDTK